MLRYGEVAGRAIAVFPFLKTSDPIRLGNVIFRSTDDLEGLELEDAAHIREIADILYLQDDVRIKSASYAILPTINLDKDGMDSSVAELERIQAVVAFCYSDSHPTLGDPFFSFEQSSLAIFSPEPVSLFLVRPEHNVVAPKSLESLNQDDWQRVSGYYGRYNFRHPFWVVKNSRLYPPVPHIVLNISQNLYYDLERWMQSERYSRLPDLLKEWLNPTQERVLKAIRWFNRANGMRVDEYSAILDLAVAFETLLGLPRDAKTDRFVDAVSLLLGRVERLDTWARQFYDARSDIAHEGETKRLHFAPREKNVPYQPHLSYGRQIFQLCVGAVLHGANLSQKVGIAEKFVTNEERFSFICETLNDDALKVDDRFKMIAQTVNLIDNYLFAGESGIPIKILVGAVQNAARNLLVCEDSIDQVRRAAIDALAKAPRSQNFFEALEALKNLRSLRISVTANMDSPVAITWRLADAVWHYAFWHYFSVLEERQNRRT